MGIPCERHILPLVLLVRLRRASLSVLLLLVLLGLVVHGLDFLHLSRLLLLLLIMVLLLLLMVLQLLRLHLVLLGLSKARGVLGLDGGALRLLALSVHLGLLAVLRVDSGLGSENFHRTVVAAAGDHVLALVAAVLGILEPVSEAGHAGQADADETEESADEAIAKTLDTNLYTRWLVKIEVRTFAWSFPPCESRSWCGGGRTGSRWAAAGRRAC